MKYYIIDLYYNFLMYLEDVCGYLLTKINNHRKSIDEKFFNIAY